MAGRIEVGVGKQLSVPVGAHRAPGPAALLRPFRGESDCAVML